MCSQRLCKLLKNNKSVEVRKVCNIFISFNASILKNIIEPQLRYSIVVDFAAIFLNTTVLLFAVEALSYR